MSLPPLGELQQDPELLRVPERLIDLPVFRGCITLLSGREKVGKSTKINQEIAAASPHLNVLWLAVDEWKGFTVQRLTKSGAATNLLIEDTALELSDLERICI